MIQFLFNSPENRKSDDASERERQRERGVSNLSWERVEPKKLTLIDIQTEASRPF